MYLTERLVGVLVYAAFLVLACLVISSSKTKRVGMILLIYNCLLAAMAFMFVPNTGADLYRLVPIMHNYSQFNFQEIWRIALNSSTPSATYICIYR